MLLKVLCNFLFMPIMMLMWRTRWRKDPI